MSDDQFPVWVYAGFAYHSPDADGRVRVGRWNLPLQLFVGQRCSSMWMRKSSAKYSNADPIGLNPNWPWPHREPIAMLFPEDLIRSRSPYWL